MIYNIFCHSMFKFSLCWLYSLMYRRFLFWSSNHLFLLLMPVLLGSPRNHCQIQCLETSPVFSSKSFAFYINLLFKQPIEFVSFIPFLVSEKFLLLLSMVVSYLIVKNLPIFKVSLKIYLYSIVSIFHESLYPSN
jgi:hypothetical protein